MKRITYVIKVRRNFAEGYIKNAISIITENSNIFDEILGDKEIVKRLYEEKDIKGIDKILSQAERIAKCLDEIDWRRDRIQSIINK